MSCRTLLGALACLPLLVACQKSEAPEAQTTAPVEAPASGTPDWNAFVEGVVEDHVKAHPAWAVTQGRHEFDGQLPDWSRAGIEAEIARLHAVRDAALRFGDDVLDAQQRYQREYIVSRVDAFLFWAEKARWPFRNPQFYFDWMNDSLDPSAYITLDYAPKAERMAGFTRYLESVPQAAASIRENLELPMPLTWLQLGIDAFGGYAAYFGEDVPGIWSDVDDASLQQRFAAANEAAIAAMQSLADWLEENRASATDDYALGPELFRQMLWDTERVDISLEELEAIGRADMARNIQGLRDACVEFAPGASLQDCMAKMSARKPEEGSVEAARQQLQETREFVVEQDLVSIPGTEEALVAEAPPYARSNSAYINIPGPWENNQPSVYYISPPNPAWPEEVQADYIAGESDLLFTSVHEVWPGHFLNFLHANRASWFYGRAFVTYAFGEGWAHYTEEMMLDAGLRGADPETRIGQLSNALLRNARFLSTIGLHTKGWSVEDSKRFFMDEAYQSEGTAIQQAARGTYDPAYLNYTMGKLLIRQLREDWTASRGGRAAWREFHDTFLGFGGPPIPLVRQQMMGEPEPRAVFSATQEQGAPDQEEGQLNWAWNCEDGRYIVSRYKDDSLWLFLPGDSVQLTHEVSASGARYAAEGIEFWSKGEEGTLTEGDTATVCRVDREASIWEDAKLRGADFRGVGNEPGWHLELFSDQPSVLVSDYGRVRIEFDAGAPKPTSETGSVFEGATPDGAVIRVFLDLGPCQDTMIEREYETTVRVEFGDQSLTGCGRALH